MTICINYAIITLQYKNGYLSGLSVYSTKNKEEKTIFVVKCGFMKKIVEKWYNKLSFPKAYDEEFSELLSSARLIPSCIGDFCPEQYSYGECLLYYLYFCESTKKKYEELGISEDILLDTLSDIVIWTNTHYSILGELGLSELNWLSRHLEPRLFKLGRLQFCIADSEFDIEEVQIKRGDKIIEIHIPEGEPMTPDRCLASIARANTFFKEHFPEYKWSYYTCHSWLLDDTLLSFVKDGSNIAEFYKLFKIAGKNPSDSALKYIFRRDTTRENISDFTAKSTLAQNIKAHVMTGGRLYEGLGYIERK